ncbi:hypothetical protein Rhe02_37890 [Rhizocola hellebori]|uniref:Uncharacterized protein n=1 Tax=Rhizocola hellebori TaxID=1392758 RepID=A0A8J3Q9K9_9ACTN|nr:hypothetical protein [Rhizocola hellebori]GIH05722.1 hypothetical protein Rhe02_37890 [Rhizocola hellebori]
MSRPESDKVTADPTPPRHPWLYGLAAFTLVLLMLTAAAVVFRSAASPHAYAKPADTDHDHTTPPPRPLPRREFPDQVLAALARQAATGPAPQVTSASVFCELELWTRQGAAMSRRRTTSWRDLDGSGYLHTLTLPDIPATAFTTPMVGANLWADATPSRQTFTAGQLPAHRQWPPTLAAEPDVMLRQLETIRPGIDSPAQLLRAIAAAHTSYLITRETRAAELTLLATTAGISVRTADIPTYTAVGPPAPGLYITTDDVHGHITLHLHADTGYLAAAVEHSYLGGGGNRRVESYVMFIGTQQHLPTGR